ncbi:PREDICTED: sec-independent protein translocase protein TATA, chloroplastic-like [Ipomoea nil]|uniref:sec-independent protein translocase protein TATA, chloroplastic-like n=1 Tax=Ipomoea nil TaxID=35883 RepID=UPI000900A890|nr:PREDICTED: sec-independent protein translocase protein TATA, chloroplastic-like [Ipomoea nil]
MATISSVTPTISLSRSHASKLTSSSSSSTVALSSSSSLFLRSNGAGLRMVSGQRAARSSGGRKRFSCNCLFGLGVPELVVIAGVAALVFGPKKLPEVGRSIGKTFKGFQQAAKEFETELKKEPDSLAQAPSEGVEEINQQEKRDATVSSTKEDS